MANNMGKHTDYNTVKAFNHLNNNEGVYGDEDHVWLACGDSPRVTPLRKIKQGRYLYHLN